MHAFLIAMNAWGVMVVIGLILSLKDGDRTGAGGAISGGISLGLSLWAFALLVTGH